MTHILQSISQLHIRFLLTSFIVKEIWIGTVYSLGKDIIIRVKANITEKQNPHVHLQSVPYEDGMQHPMFSFRVRAKQKKADDQLVYHSAAAVEVSAIHDHYNAVRARESVAGAGCLSRC